MKFVLVCFSLLTFISCNNAAVDQSAGNKKNHATPVLAFLPYRDFDTSFLQLLAKETQDFYHCNTIILPSQILPPAAFYQPRQRYKADSLLLFQKQLLPSGSRSVVGLTSSDISTTSRNAADWGVFGLGFCPGSACVISTHRLSSTTRRQLENRLVKVVLHEIGHNLGIPHCENDNTCLMNDAKGTIAQVDREKKWLCAKCRQLLRD